MHSNHDPILAGLKINRNTPNLQRYDKECNHTNIEPKQMERNKMPLKNNILYFENNQIERKIRQQRSRIFTYFVNLCL